MDICIRCGINTTVSRNLNFCEHCYEEFNSFTTTNYKLTIFPEILPYVSVIFMLYRTKGDKSVENKNE